MTPKTTTTRLTNRAGIVLICIATSLAGCGDNQPTQLSKAELMNPATCKTCHPQQFADWEGSMHAYAAEDPVFLAMNRRMQREAPTLGTFCVKCHAPLATSLGLTTDGLNLASLPPETRGVTCYFCHSADAVNGTHNNPLALNQDGTLNGPFADPVPGTPHRSRYSPLFDYTRNESAAACGTCHDITNQHNLALERTYSEWQGTLFADPTVGQTCGRCHMDATMGPASTTSRQKLRPLRSHSFPGVDVALSPFPARDEQKQGVQEALDGTLQGTLCVTDSNRIEVSLDNANAGHGWPSGATQDRRAWVEVTAYVDQRVVYQSGRVPADQSVESIDDPDLWLLRDCIYDENDQPVHNFWDAVSTSPSNQIPGPVKPTVTDPSSFTRGHVRYLYPVTGTLSERPNRVTMEVFIKPVGDDVLADLVSTGDLDPNVAGLVPTFELQGATSLEWTPTAGPPTDIQTRMTVNGLTCVGSQVKQYRNLKTIAASRRRCLPKPPPS